MYIYPTDTRRPVPLTPGVKDETAVLPLALNDLFLDQWFPGPYKERHVEKIDDYYMRTRYYVITSEAGGRPNRCIQEMFDLKVEGNVIIVKECKWESKLLKCRSEDLDLLNIVVLRWVTSRWGLGVV